MMIIARGHNRDFPRAGRFLRAGRPDAAARYSAADSRRRPSSNDTAGT